MRFGVKVCSSLLLVLVAAVGIQLLFAFQPKSITKPPHLSESIPSAVDGFFVKDEPLGPTEYVHGSVAKALNYDDYVHRYYRKNDLELGVYIAYWGPGKMPTRDIASHTPDRCWTDNGMACRSARFRAPVAGGEQRLAPAEWREFTSPGLARPIWVYFWLRAGDTNYDFGREFNALTNPTEWIRSVWKNTSLRRREHYFFRVTSSRPFEEVRNDPGYQELISALAKLGLVAD